MNNSGSAAEKLVAQMSSRYSVCRRALAMYATANAQTKQSTNYLRKLFGARKARRHVFFVVLIIRQKAEHPNKTQQMHAISMRNSLRFSHFK